MWNNLHADAECSSHEDGRDHEFCIDKLTWEEMSEDWNAHLSERNTCQAGPFCESGGWWLPRHHSGNGSWCSVLPSFEV